MTVRAADVTSGTRDVDLRGPFRSEQGKLLLLKKVL